MTMQSTNVQLRVTGRPGLGRRAAGALRALAFGVVVALVPAVHAAGEPPATIPYQALYGALAPALEAQAVEGVVALKIIESKIGVAPEKIRIRIAARSGPVELVPKPDGTIDFPLTDALRDENPTVTTNQPKGSLTLSVTLAIAPPPGATLPAPKVIQALDRIEQVLNPGATGGHIRGVEVRFAPGASGTVTVRGGSNRFLMADETGRVVLMRDSDLVGADTEIEFSQRPLLLLPQL